MDLGALSASSTEAFAINDLLCCVQSVTMSGRQPALAVGATVLTPQWLGKLIGDGMSWARHLWHCSGLKTE